MKQRRKDGLNRGDCKHIINMNDLIENMEVKQNFKYLLYIRDDIQTDNSATLKHHSKLQKSKLVPIVIRRSRKARRIRRIRKTSENITLTAEMKKNDETAKGAKPVKKFMISRFHRLHRFHEIT
jgi:hypothetical protein